jgi:amino acid adenylation domain-containing protein
MDQMSILVQLQETDPDNRIQVMNLFLRQCLTDFLELDSIDEIEPNQNFAELGTSSTEAVSFKIELESKLSIPLRTTLLFDYPALDVLGEYLLGLLSLPTSSNQLASNEESTTPPENSSNKRIAVLATAGMFPGVTSVEDFWEATVTGRLLKLPNDTYAFGKLNTVAVNPTYFSMREEDLRALNRQQELLLSQLEVALISASISLSDLQKNKTGIFIGAEYFSQFNGSYDIPPSNALSFYLNLEGPSETYNSYCTSSFVALHKAVQSLQSGECTYAIVGGVNCIEDKEFERAAAKGWYDAILSNDNKTRSFCSEANGFVRSEGVGVVILTTFQHAEMRHHEVQALIHASAVHHGGRGFSLDAPNVKGIREAIRSCITQANISTDSIDYIEAHGIGNTLADALELGAINEVYNSYSQVKNKRWYISSIKPTIGHPERASGIASLLKVIKAIQQNTIPGLAGFTTLTPEVPDTLSLVLQKLNTEWGTNQMPKRAALNSYAIGGVNAHVIVEQYIPGLVTNDSAVTSSSPELKKDIHSTLSKEKEKILSELFLEILQVEVSDLDPSLSLIQFGFNSLKVVQLIKKINARLQLDIRISQVFGIENLAAFFLLIENAPPIAIQPDSNTHHSAKVPCPLSETQKGLWFIQESDTTSTGFNVPICFRIKQELNASALQNSIDQILLEHPILSVNTHREPNTESIVQYFNGEKRKVIVQEKEISPGEEELQFLYSLLRSPFDLSKENLVRTYLIRKEGKTAYLYFVVHHIVFDGLSGIIFSNKLWQYYNDYLHNKVVNTNPAEYLFYDFVHWERQYLESDRSQRDLLWWQEELNELPSTITLPYDHPFIGRKQGAGSQFISIDPQLFDQFKNLSKTLKCNLSVLLLSAFNVFLSKISSQKDISVTTPVAGRPSDKYAESIGCYINLIVTRTRVSTHLSFSELVEHVQQKFTQCLDHAEFPFPKIVSALGLKNDPAQLALPVSYTYQNIFDDLGASIPALHQEVFQETDDHYTLEIYDKGNSLQLNLKYQKHLFEEYTIQRHLKQFLHLLGQILDDPSRNVGRLSILSDEDRKQLLVGFNSMPLDVPSNRCVHHFIVEQCKKTPEAVALYFHEEKITYRELELRSRNIALLLQQKGITPDECVAFYMERSADAICTLLGILRSGAAYLPLDVTNAPERIDFIIADAKVRFVLTHQHLLHNVQRKQAGVEFITLDNLDGSTEAESIREIASPQHLCYVLYTSGSTGKPKGVMVEHRSLLNLAYGMIAAYQLTNVDKILQFAPLSFDMSVEEIFPYLVCGASVVVRVEEDKDVRAFQRLVTLHQVSVLNLTPAYFGVLNELSAEEQAFLFASVRIISFGGEALPDHVLQASQRNKTRIFNAYGPTECTVNAAIAEVTTNTHASVGKPFYNTSLYILDQQLELVPAGVAGELYVAGIQVARGYLNNETLTQQFFLDNPFGQGRMYKTGDKARWRQDGTIEYLGRVDDQIKIRGFRVEPSEIEQVLMQYPSIKQATVLHTEGQLAAFYISEVEISENIWKNFLTGKLPEYMVPSILVRLDVLPVTSNGKVDKIKLSNVYKENRKIISRSTKTPLNDTEKRIQEVWTEIFKRSDIDVCDNFFDLGGHSLMAIQITLRVSRIFQQEITLRDFFNAGSIRALSEKIIGLGNQEQVDTMYVFEEDKNYVMI